MHNLSSPPFVVIEGLDGSGTTTQAQRVTAALRARGQAVNLSCEPTDGPIGQLIRQMISMEIAIEEAGEERRPMGRETLALLFAADRLYHLEAIIEPALQRGEWVISDRYYHSSLVYQGDVDEEDRVDYEWVRQINSRARQPDMTVFLQADVELSLSRLAGRESFDIFESRQKLTRLQKRYEEVMGFLAAQGQAILRLDAARPAEELTDQILEALAQGFSRSDS